MPENQRRPVGLHLAWLISVAAASVFVTALIAITGDLATLWPLYIIPIVIAALAYEVAGAIVAVAACTALVSLLVFGGGLGPSLLPELLVGAVAYTISGVVIGVQAHSYRRQRDLLQLDSIRDPVTEAFTADHLESLLADELRRTERYGLQCTFAVVQVVGFEEFRRTYGRIRAEQLLRRLVEVLHLAVRDTDVIGRYGHDAFAVILPLTGSGEAKLVTDRVKTAVETTAFEGDALEPTVRCPVAIATATCPEDSCDPDAIEAAVDAQIARSLLARARAEAPPRAAGAETPLPDTP